MKRSEAKQNLITKTALKQERGWTDKLIDTFLRKPDAEKTNPKYNCAPSMKLYDLARVEAIEATADFQRLKGIVAKRQNAARKATATKEAKVRDYVDSVTIRLPSLSRRELIQRACDDYNERQEVRAELGLTACDMKATPDSDEAFLDRISVNYLRHRMTKYDRALDHMKGKVGVSDAYQDIRAKIFDEITDKYPWLATECKRQDEEAMQRQVEAMLYP